MSSLSQVAPHDLEGFALFDTLAAQELENLASILEMQQVSAGRYVIREGSEGSDLFFVVGGKLKVCRVGSGGKEVTIALCGRGDVVGEIAMLTRSARSADVIALTNATLWRCARDQFERHCQQFPCLAYALLQYMAKRVQNGTRRITDLALYDVTCRVARILFELSVVSTQDGEIVNTINEKPTHQILASMAGASREAVTRALGVLVDEGHLEIDEERMWLYSMPE